MAHPIEIQDTDSENDEQSVEPVQIPGPLPSSAVLASLVFPNRDDVQSLLTTMGFSPVNVMRAMRFYQPTLSMEDMVEHCILVDKLGSMPEALKADLPENWTFIGSSVTLFGYWYRVADVDKEFCLIHLLPQSSGYYYDWQDVGPTYMDAKWVHLANENIQWREICHEKELWDDHPKPRTTLKLPSIRVKLPDAEMFPSQFEGHSFKFILDKLNWYNFYPTCTNSASEWRHVMFMTSRIAPFASKYIFNIRSPSQLRTKRYRDSVLEHTANRRHLS